MSRPSPPTQVQARLTELVSQRRVAVIRRRWWPTRDERIVAVLRVALLLGSVLLAAATGSLGRLAWSYAALAVVVLLALLPVAPARTGVAALVEALATVAIATVAEPAGAPLLVYWLAPALASGLRRGYRWAAVVAGAPLPVGLVLVQRDPGEFDAQSSVTLVQWAMLSLGIGILGAWVKSQERARVDQTAASYREAVRVLTELEQISRRLPTGLDVGTLALQVLEDLMTLVPCERGVVLIPDSTGTLVAVAGVPDAHAQWLPDSSVADWVRGFDGQAFGFVAVHDASALVVRLAVGDRAVGYVVLDEPQVTQPVDAAQIDDTARRGTVALEAALLFDAVRVVATDEERRRIAREIHDGIAQDIAFLGYAADEIVELAPEGELRDLAADLRGEISRVVGELRMSVLTLRETVPSGRTLGSSISDYARRIFDDESTQIHVRLDESAQRLRPAVESELLRIAQEALTNARRHASADNLWISCRVLGPHASLLIEDDGEGMGPKRVDSYGLEIMAERARKIRASLNVAARPGGGTVVSIEV